ncbi:hypothetical protein D9M68_927040 [compost metagenome]
MPFAYRHLEADFETGSRRQRCGADQFQAAQGQVGDVAHGLAAEAVDYVDSVDLAESQASVLAHEINLSLFRADYGRPAR